MRKLFSGPIDWLEGTAACHNHYLLHLQMFSAKRTPMLFKAQLHDVVNDMLGIHGFAPPAGWPADFV